MSLDDLDDVTLDLQQQRHAAQDPLSCLLLALEVERPDEGRAAGLGLVDGTLVDVACVHAVDGDGLDEDDRHGRVEFLQSRLLDHTCQHSSRHVS